MLSSSSSSSAESLQRKIFACHSIIASRAHKTILPKVPLTYLCLRASLIAIKNIMRFALASALLLAANLAPHAAAEDVITLTNRHYYAYGYEGDTTTGAPNG